MTHYCILNGALKPENEAMLHISDLSVRRGYGIFDYFRVNKGVPMYMDKHLDRFMSGAQAAGLDHGFRKNELADQILALLRTNKSGEDLQGVRLVLTGGYSNWQPESPNLMITQEPLKGYDQSCYDQGAGTISYAFKRELSHIKTISYMTAVMLTPELKRRQAIEVLYHLEGKVSEFSRSNLFIIRNGKILTPASGILSGITRGLVMELAEAFGGVTESDISLEDVLGASEVFMTSTIKRIIPVIRIDDHIIGNGKPGQVTRSLMEQLNARDIQEMEVHKQSMI